jgi:hypothetical protein
MTSQKSLRHTYALIAGSRELKKVRRSAQDAKSLSNREISMISQTNLQGALAEQVFMLKKWFNSHFSVAD